MAPPDSAALLVERVHAFFDGVVAWIHQAEKGAIDRRRPEVLAARARDAAGAEARPARDAVALARGLPRICRILRDARQFLRLRVGRPERGLDPLPLREKRLE